MVTGLEEEQLRATKSIARGLLELTEAIKGFTKAIEKLEQKIDTQNDLMMKDWKP